MSITSITSIPNDILIEIALNMTLDELSAFCRTNKKANDYLCDNDDFWRRRFLQDYGSAEKYETWKETYKGKVFSFGLNKFGQLGLGDRRKRDKPTQVQDIHPKKVACGMGHTIIIDINNNVLACGKNDNGQLGLGDSVDRVIFEQVYIQGKKCKAKLVACNKFSTFLIDMNNDVWCCGDNQYGQLGLGDNNDRNIFTKVDIGKSIQITCSKSDTFLIDENNTLFACGDRYTNVFEIFKKDIKHASAHHLLSYIDMNDEVWVEQTSSPDTIFKKIGIRAKFISSGSRSTYIIDMKNDLYDYNDYSTFGGGDTLTKYTIKAKYCCAATSYVLFIDMNNDVWIEGSNIYTHVRQKTNPYVLRRLNIKARYVACKYYHSFIIS